MAAALPVARRPIVLGDLVAGTALRDVALVIGGAAFVGALAQLSLPVPGSPVPITGQTFGVLLAGAALGWRRGLASMLLYLVAGAAGLPWYAGHAHGVAHPDFGYIIGFVLAASVVGALAQRGGDRTPLRTVLTMALGTVLVYLVGVPYLAVDLHVSLGTAIHLGLRPFLVGDAIKVLLAAGVLPGTWALLNRAFR